MLKLLLLSTLFLFASVYSYVIHNATIDKRDASPYNGAMVHYYWDGGCKDFANGLRVNNNAMDKCLQYYIPGAWSMNVVDCYHTQCFCMFFTDTKCKNLLKPSAFSGYTSNWECLNDGGQAVQSISCGYIFN